MTEVEDSGDNLLGTELFEEGNNCWKITTAERFGWCIDGEQYFGAIRDSIAKAQREILIVGWDIDSRFELIRDKDDQRYPAPLREVLEQQVKDNEDLRVYILSWDFAVIFVLERELLPARAFGWENSRQLHFQLDDQHAVGASHHQKIVVIDSAIAYSGGFDLTKCRWDTREHAADDSRRRGPDGDAYMPFHDVQAVVTGPAAADLRALVSERWANATGDDLPDAAGADDADSLWPVDIAVQFHDVATAISRTWRAVDGEAVVDEVRRLYLDMIASAETSIYIENQYFTSVEISQQLARALQREDGPEIVIVLPSKTSGWLEQATMDVLRDQAISRIIEADRFDRLRVVSAISDDLVDTSINLHAKIMVVDLQVARIGSANLSHRSMSLDTECDLTVTDSEVATALCADLLAEHLGAKPESVANSLTEAGLLATLDRFTGNARHLEPLEFDVDDTKQAVLQPVAKVADMEKPIVRSHVQDSQSSFGSQASGWFFLAAIALGIAFWLYWAMQGNGREFTSEELLASLRELADHPVAPLLAVPLFVLGSLLVAPVTGMIALCGLLFDPWVASASALAGTLLATGVNHWLGSHFHGTLMRRVPDSVTKRIKSIASSSDILTLAGLRMIPIAPFTFVNLAIGASGISLRDFLIGTALAMTPGILLICLSVDRARAALAGEAVFDTWIVVGIALAGVAIILMRLLVKRRAEG